MEAFKQMEDDMKPISMDWQKLKKYPVTVPLVWLAVIFLGGWFGPGYLVDFLAKRLALLMWQAADLLQLFGNYPFLAQILYTQGVQFNK